MKYLIFIFAFYFASLAAMPCQDVADAQVNCTSEVTCTTELDEHEPDDQHPDEDNTEDCSPFCFCHCCHHAYSVLTLHSENAFIPLVMENQDSFSLSMFSMKHFSIWHPPKA